MAAPDSLLGCFIGALPEGIRPPTDGEIAESLSMLVTTARAAWPELRTEAERLAAHVGARVPAGVETDQLLVGLRAPDLYVACACLAGEQAALEILDARFVRPVRPVLERLDVGSGVVDETLQRVRQWLVVGKGGSPPKLADYAGRGSLSSWVRVIAVREALALSKRRRREVPLEDDALLVDTAERDPELEHVKRLYRAEFKEVFQEALTTLTPRERNLLRHQLLDGLNIDQIGAIYRIHRATAARRLARIREKLLRETRRRLAARLDASRATVESIMRLVHTRLDVSIQRFLEPADE